MFPAQALVAQTRVGGEPSPEDVLAKADQALSDAPSREETVAALASGPQFMDMPRRFLAKARSLLSGNSRWQSQGGVPQLVLPVDAVALSRKVEQDPIIDEPTPAQTIGGWFIQSLVYGCLVFIVAYFCYPQKLEIDMEAAKSQFEDKPFTYGPFSCLDNMEVCLWSFCCPSIKWGDNMQAVGFFGFAAAIAIYLCFQLTADLILITWLFGALFCAYQRQKMRTLFNMENGSSQGVIDFLLYCWCCCCAIAQEHRQLLDVKKDKEPSAA